MDKKLRQYAGMTLGIAIAAVAMNMFFIPHKIAAGGVSGLATVLHHLFGIPVGVTMLGFNIPIFIAGLKILGTRYGVNTLYGAAMLSLLIDLSAPFTPVLTDDILLNALYGGITVGMGLGLTFRFHGNTAGTSLLAAIINRLYGFTIGRALLMADVAVVAFAGFAFNSAELSLYAALSIYVTSKVIDLVQEGPMSTRSFIIAAREPEALADKIFAGIDRGVTFVEGRGGYTGDNRTLLLCVVESSETPELKDIIHEHDPRAFVLISDAYEVLGEGFVRYEKKKK